MVDWKFKIGKLRFRIRNMEIFTFVVLTTLYVLAAVIREDTWIYDSIASLSSNWHDIAVGSTSALLTAFIFATFGNTSVLIIFPYILIVYDIAQFYPNWLLLGLVSGLGAAIGEITSYIVGRLIGASKKMSESEMGEKFHRIRAKFEEKPASIPITIFLFALTPLPDDAILVPFGMMKYPYWKSIPPCTLGKTILCTFMSWLGFMVGSNLNYLNGLIEEYPYLGFLRLIVPTEDINPSSDIIMFSLVFIIIYIMVRMDFEKLQMKSSKDRKKFQKLILDGGNVELNKLIEEYNVLNTIKFKEFMKEFVNKYQNISIKDELFHFDAISDNHLAFDQSMEFISFFYSTEIENDEDPDDDTINDKQEN